MKGCARTCLLGLLGWLIASGAFYSYLRNFGEFRPQIFWASVGAGLCVALAFSWAFSVIAHAKERETLLAAMVGHPPKDGEWTAVSGTIRSLNPLHTPITGVSAVTYTYDMYRMERSGKNTTKVTYYEGKALAASTIASKQGAIRLLAVPTLDVKSETPSSELARSNAEQYVRSTTFQTGDTPKDERIGMDEEASDDDGVFRLDKKNNEAEVDVASLLFDEKHIKQGEVVCAFGLYSAQRGGLIPHPNWAKQTRIMRGDAQAVAAQLQGRMIRYSIAIVFFLAGAFGIVKLYERHAREQTRNATVISSLRVAPDLKS